MSKFFVNTDNIFENENMIKLIGEDVNHIKNVLRASLGEELVVCDGAGYDYKCIIASLGKNEIVLNFSEKVKCDTEPLCKVTLYQGIAKGERMDQLIQKCVELGVYRIVPVICNRTVVRFSNDKDKENKRIRWQRIALEAAKQCNRGIVPEIGEIVRFGEAVNQAGENGLKFIPYEEEMKASLKDVLNNTEKEGPKNICFFIGPEGGFDKAEIDLAVEYGFETVSLGKRILRTETAGAAVLAVLGYVLGF